ncbi:hypothetical protein Hanom_Chr16g01502081 [Helianthus anomalus]
MMVTVGVRGWRWLGGRGGCAAGVAAGGGGAAVVGVVQQGWRCFSSGCAGVMVVRW